MENQPRDANQERHELERQKFKLQKELATFAALGEQLKAIEKKSHQGDEVARRQVQQLELLAKGEIGIQMQALLKQLDELQAKYQRLTRLSLSAKKKGAARESGQKDNETKLKKKRRNRIKYL